MVFHSVDKHSVIKVLDSNENYGLSVNALEKNRFKYGKNTLSDKKRRPIIFKIGESLKEPMLLILCFSFIIAFGVNLGKTLKNGDGDFTECLGILAAIILSVLITLIMEGSSEKAFNSLNRIYDRTFVTVVREGKSINILREEVVVGDVILIGGGDKIVADGRVIYSDCLYVDESALTGESRPLIKTDEMLEKDVPLAERKNMLYSGTFVTAGSGKMIVTAVGESTEMGKIALELKNKKEISSPLEQKLSKLGKTITAIGVGCSLAVFIISLVKLIIVDAVTFENVENLAISSIILIVAAVPEGLPTIVAVSLALNMIKLAKGNALIKKMIATETAGAVSVICSDKTGTLTTGVMSVSCFYAGGKRFIAEKLKNTVMLENCILNCSVEKVKANGDNVLKGDGTEKALLIAAEKAIGTESEEFRKRYKTQVVVPFSSEKKYMITLCDDGYKKRFLLKGAMESVLGLCKVNEKGKEQLLFQAESEQKKAGRVLCLAHYDSQSGSFDTSGKFELDGFVVLKDEIREDVRQAIKDCKSAGIKIKILTGDNALTAKAVAEELGVIGVNENVVNAWDMENLPDEEFNKILNSAAVIARSTPIIKLKIVKALKKTGEVIAVTGDGINDAPALKHADVGIAMGLSGSEIAKEAADVVLLDDDFSTIVKAIAFGRNVYKNLQRFILFQLSVNLSALLFITVSAFMGLEAPFNTLQLLWINVIMDGPPALTLGLEKEGADLMREKPVEREKSIVTSKMFLRILFGGVFTGTIMIFQYATNFLGVSESERDGTVFTLFICFQLFNAFNCRELGSESIFKHLKDNKVMVVAFISVFVMHMLIVQYAGRAFGVSAMSAEVWIKTVALAFSIVAVSEAYKLLYRLLIRKSRETFGKRKVKTVNKNRAGA